MSAPVGVPVKGTKAVVAAIGSVATAVSSAATALATFVGDDRIDVNEVGGIVVTLAALATTVWGVYQTRNEPK